MQRHIRIVLSTVAALGLFGSSAQATTLIPDGRSIAPAGFTIPVEGFAAASALSPDGKWLAVLSLDGGAIDVISTAKSTLAERLAVPSASGMTWTTDGLYVTRGYTGLISRFGYDVGKAAFTKRDDIKLAPGLANGIAEDPATHRLVIARTAEHDVFVIDDTTGSVLQTLHASGEPYGIALVGTTIVASLYNSDHVDAWPTATADAIHIPTGAHPTQMLADGTQLFVANADGHAVVAIDATTLTVTKHFDLAVSADAPPGQTPAGMAISGDRTTLFVAESGFNDVAVVDLASARTIARIPTAWYPTSLTFVAKSTVGKKGGRMKPQLWITSAKGLGSQPDPGGEWNGTYTGLVQHIVIEPGQFASWSAQVARNDKFTAPVRTNGALPPIKHVVVIVRENKQFDEEFGDERMANADPALLLYGKRYTPNAHALAEAYTMMDNFMSDGEASIYGHAWDVQGMANDYHERNAHVRDEGSPDIHARVAWSIWPYAQSGEDVVTPTDMDFDWLHDLGTLPKGPRVNVSAIFGPRGELIDELQRRNVSFRVYGEQMTMRPDGTIDPGLAAHGLPTYPGTHIDFGILDTDRATMFLSDVRKHGDLPAYSFLTLPTDHTAGTTAGFLTPASYVASNDVATGQIIAGLSKRPDWRSTIVIVLPDDAQGTGDHVDSHRMPVFVVGPYVRRAFVDHTRYSVPSVMRTVEALFNLRPLNIYDASATPLANAFARQAAVVPYTTLASNIPIEKNPGKATAVSLRLDGADSADVPNQEWRSIHGNASLAEHVAYLHRLDPRAVAERDANER